MKLKLTECVRAFQAVMEMMGEESDYTLAHALVMAKRELEPHVMFYGEKEEDLIGKYAKRDEKGDMIRDGNKVQVENMSEFLKERKELDGVEVEVTSRRMKKVPEKVKPSVLDGLLLVFTFPEEGDSV